MGRVFAATDFHGMSKLVDKIFNFLQEDDKLIFCGDAIDRGPDSLEITLKLKNDPRCIYLKGNHEDMAAAAIKDILTDNIDNLSLYLWTSNGGKTTFEQIKNTNLSLPEWYNYFSKLPLRYTYRNKNNQIIVCDHAGFTPGRIADPLWDRKHFYQKWPIDTIYENLYVVHGHTPIQLLGSKFAYIDKNGELQQRNRTNPDTAPACILKYCNGHKINLDLCSAVTKKVALLDLDTFEEIYFSEED